MYIVESNLVLEMYIGNMLIFYSNCDTLYITHSECNDKSPSAKTYTV